MKALALVVLLVAGCSKPEAAPAAPQAPPPPPVRQAVATDEEISFLLNKFETRMYSGFHVVSSEVIAKGTIKDKPAELIRFKATADFGDGTDPVYNGRHICGQIAISFDPEWKTWTYLPAITDLDMHHAGGTCDDPRVLCWGCGDPKPLSVVGKKQGFQFDWPAAPSKPDAGTK